MDKGKFSLSKMKSESMASIEAVSNKGGIFDDIRQSFVVMKNEFKKYFRGKKMLLFFALIVLVLLLLTVLPYVFDDGLGSDSGPISVMYISFVSLIVLLAGTLFSSTALVSEFEERTALILFTRPIKKSAIFLGKFMAAFLTCLAFIVLYYVVTILVLVILVSGVDASILTSLCMAALYAFGVTGVALLISSVMKKGSTASILTFVVLLLLLPVISGVLMASGIDTWWLLSDVSDAILGSLNGYASGMSYVGVEVEPVNIGESAMVMVVWGIVTTIISYFLFKRRDF